MSALRVLLIGTETAEAQQICSLLERADHTVFPVPNFAEASEALLIQKFDALLIASPEPPTGAQPFLARLRQDEKNGRTARHLPVLSLAAAAGAEGLTDAILPSGFEPAAFAQTVENLANAVSQTQDAGTGAHGMTGDDAGSPKDLEIFSPSEFEQQVAYDPELMVEIIDMFLAERELDLVAMTEALASGDLDRLMRAAHTIKGSLGSLHAHVARHRSQALEIAAKNGNRQACISLLGALEQDLNDLEPQLLSLRDSVQSSS